MKIGFDRQELLDALQKQERNQMTVAYYLILDHKRRKMLGASPVMHATQLATAASAMHDQPLPLPASATDVAAPPPLMQPPPANQGAPPGLPGAVRPPLVPPLTTAAPKAGPDTVQRRWHLGVQSSLAPADMMLEIFRVLRALRFGDKRAHCCALPPPPQYPPLAPCIPPCPPAVAAHFRCARHDSARQHACGRMEDRRSILPQVPPMHTRACRWIRWRGRPSRHA